MMIEVGVNCMMIEVGCNEVVFLRCTAVVFWGHDLYGSCVITMTLSILHFVGVCESVEESFLAIKYDALCHK